MLKFASVLLIFSLACIVHSTEEFKNVEEAKDAAFRSEEKGLWKKINWVYSSADALKLAQQEKKPIMVFLLVGKFGQANAAEC